MEQQHLRTTARFGAYTTIIGSMCMIIGAAIWASTGADIDLALDNNDMAGYLEQIVDNRYLLLANLSVWIIGVIFIGAGATMMANLSVSRPVRAALAKYNYWIGVPIVVIAYVAWLSIVARLTPDSAPDVAVLAEMMGWFASRADWLATILILGTGPALIAGAARSDWMPRWLAIWSIICFITGVLNAVAMYAGGLTTYGFVIIPVGMGWMIAASIVLFRKSRTY